MQREEAYSLLTSYLKTENLIRHSLASEAVMRCVAGYLGEDAEVWGIAGLLHDIDLDIVQGDMMRHAVEGASILQSAGVDPLIVEAVRLHNEQAHGIKRSTRFHHALAAAETITGLVTATALVYPDKKLASVKPKSVRKRYKEKLFAAGANREIIAECEQAGVAVDDLCDMALTAMQEIAPELGL